MPHLVLSCSSVKLAECCWTWASSMMTRTRWVNWSGTEGSIVKRVLSTVHTRTFTANCWGSPERIWKLSHFHGDLEWSLGLVLDHSKQSGKLIFAVMSLMDNWSVVVLLLLFFIVKLLSLLRLLWHRHFVVATNWLPLVQLTYTHPIYLSTAPSHHQFSQSSLCPLSALFFTAFQPNFVTEKCAKNAHWKTQPKIGRIILDYFWLITSIKCWLEQSSKWNWLRTVCVAGRPCVNWWVSQVTQWSLYYTVLYCTVPPRSVLYPDTTDQAYPCSPHTWPTLALQCTSTVPYWTQPT